MKAEGYPWQEMDEKILLLKRVRADFEPLRYLRINHLRACFTNFNLRINLTFSFKV